MRLIGVTIPDNKRIEIALTYVYGIGLERAQRALSETKVSPDKRAKDLSPEEVNKIKDFIEKNYKIEGDLRREVRDNIKHKREINTYQGVRHMRGLPVRGQKTKTNSRTVRGNVRKTMGSGRKPASQKT